VWEAATVLPPKQVMIWSDTQIIYPSGDLDLWPFDLGTGVPCQPCQPSCQFLWLFTLSSYRQTRVKLGMTSWPWCLTFYITRAWRWCGSSYSIRIPLLTFASLPFPKIGTFSASALIGQETLNFWHLHRVTGHFFPANFQHATPFHYRLRVRHGTDRQTDRQTTVIVA